MSVRLRLDGVETTAHAYQRVAGVEQVAHLTLPGLAGGPATPPADPGAPDPALWGAAPVLVEPWDSLARWYPRTGTVSNNRAYYKPANVSVAGGHLTLASKLETVGSSPYTSGDVQTYNPTGSGALWVTEGQHFRAQLVARVPVEKGFWPAPLWFRPLKGGVRNPDGSYTGGGTVDGEIDLVEVYGAEGPAFPLHATLHGPYGGSPHKKITRKSYTFADLANPDPTVEHTWTLEKVPGMVRMWCDELNYATIRDTDTSSTWSAGDYDTWFEDPDVVWAPRITVQVEATNSTVKAQTGVPDAGNDWSAAATDLVAGPLSVWTYAA